MQPREKLAHRVEPHTALQPEGIERGNHQAGHPLPALCGFPQPGFRVAVAALYRLGETMHTAFGEPRLVGKASHALAAVLTETLENPSAFLPKSHVGLCSEG
jgi:hypothetical protein